MALKLLVNYTINPGQREEFLAKAAAIRPQILAEKGCVQYEYCPSAADENKIILVEQWDSRQAQKIHLDQPHMQGIYAAEKEHVADVNLEFYDF